MRYVTAIIAVLLACSGLTTSAWAAPSWQQLAIMIRQQRIESNTPPFPPVASTERIEMQSDNHTVAPPAIPKPQWSLPPAPITRDMRQRPTTPTKTSSCTSRSSH